MPDQAAASRESRAAAWVVGALVAFAILRLGALPRYPLWTDETWTLEAGATSFRAAMRIHADDQTHPPLFYGALWAWRRVVPDGIAWLRLLPCLAAIATAVPLVALASSIGMSRRATALGTVLAAGSGFLVAYGAELRSYSLLAFLGTASLALWARARASQHSLVSLTLCNALLVYTHYFGVFVLLAEWLDALGWARRRLRALSVSAALSVAALLPWVALTFYRARVTGNRLEVLAWIPTPEPGEVLDFVTESFGSSGWPALDLVIATVVVVVIVLLAFRTRATTLAPGMRLLALAVLLPVITSSVVSLTVTQSMWVVRYLIAAAPPLLLLLASALDTLLPARATLVAGAIALLPAAFTARSLAAGREKPRYDLVVRELAARDAGASAVDVFTSEGFPLVYAARAPGVPPVLRVRGELDAANVRADSGWFVWSEVHAPPGPPPPAVLVRHGYRVGPALGFGSLRDSLVAVRFTRRGGGP